ncbi:MAG: hypothetical protein P8Y36_00500, partial [Alphaproteobacteria bacterium]
RNEREDDTRAYDDEDADSGSNRYDDDGGDTDDEGEYIDGSDGDTDADDGDANDGDDDSDAEGGSGGDTDDDTLYTVKVDGKDQKVSLQELKNGFSKSANYHNRVRQLADTHKELREGHTRVAQEYAQRLQHVNALVSNVKQLLVGDMNSLQMQQLRAEDPQGWAVQRLAMQERAQTVDAYLNGISQEIEEHGKRYREQQQRDLASTVQRELDIVRSHIKDWDEKGKHKVAKFLTDAGFSQDELNSVADSRMLLVAEKARRYDELMLKSKQATRRKKPKPTQATPRPKGGTAAKGGKGSNANRAALNNARSRLRKSGSMRDAGDAINAMMTRSRK